MRRNCAKACRSCNEMDMDVFDEDDDDEEEEEEEEENSTNDEDTSNTNTGNDRDTNVGRREDVDVDDGKYVYLVCLFVFDLFRFILHVLGSGGMGIVGFTSTYVIIQNIILYANF